MQYFHQLWQGLRPAGLDKEAARQTDRVIGYSLALMGLCPLFVVIFSLCRAPISAAIVAGAWISLVVNLLVLRRWGRERRAGQTVAVIAWLTYTPLTFLQGGHDSPALIWYATLPIIAVALINVRMGGWTLAAGSVIVSAFYAARLGGIVIPSELTPSAMMFVEYTGQLGLMLCTLALTATYTAMEAAAQRRIAAALDHAMVADRAKSEFLANMSHEIRTPLNAMLGFTDLLLENAIEPDEVPEALQTIKRNGSHLLTVISDILDLSKIESGQMTLECLPCDVCAIAQDVLQSVRSRAEPKGLLLSLQTDGAIPPLINSDPTRLKQILLNLVGNALKFTERGGITVVVRCPSAAFGRLLISVADTGIGMTEEQRGRLFRAFSQGDTSTTRRFGGTGLGLVISQRLAELLGGSIDVVSEAGVGSTFTLSLAMDRSPTMVAVPTLLPTSVATHLGEGICRGRRLLVADDMPDNRRLIAFLLNKLGAESVTVPDGAAAISAVQTAEGEHRPFDLILMDMQMPVLDGYEATRQLRSAGCTTPIVALTAHSMSTDRELCLVAGCDDYLSKPIHREQFTATLARWLSPAAVAASD